MKSCIVSVEVLEEQQKLKFGRNNSSTALPLRATADAASESNFQNVALSYHDANQNYSKLLSHNEAWKTLHNHAKLIAIYTML